MDEFEDFIHDDDAHVVVKDKDGHVKEKRFDTQAAAQAYLTKTLSDIQRGAYTAPNNKTLSVWLDEWIEGYTADLKYQTKKSYETAIREHIKPNLARQSWKTLKATKSSDLLTA